MSALIGCANMERLDVEFAVFVWHFLAKYILLADLWIALVSDRELKAQ